VEEKGSRMKTYKVELEGTTSMLFGKQYRVAELERESKADYEERTWRERLHTNSDGIACISPLAIKNCIRDAAKYLSEPIKGKGKATYTKHFKAGVMVYDQAPISSSPHTLVRTADVEPLWLNVPSDGMTGGTKRVPKAFPEVKAGWKATVNVSVLDEIITSDVLHRHITQAGNFIGLGAMRVGNGGISGRFKINSMQEV
jgi:hypothetical protein